MKSIHTPLLVLVGILVGSTIATLGASESVLINGDKAIEAGALSPSALAVSEEGQRIYVA